MDYRNKILRSISWMFVGIILIITILSDVFNLSATNRNLILSVPIISYLIFNIVFAFKSRKISNKVYNFSLAANIILLCIWIFFVFIKSF